MQEEYMMTKLEKRYNAYYDWDFYDCDLMTEYKQCMEEGLDAESMKGLFEAISALPRGTHREKMADVLFEMLEDVPMRKDYAYNEPSTIAKIRALREPAPSVLPAPDPAALPDLILGAWLGRIAGCVLGKCIEGCRTPEIKRILEVGGNLPLHRYITSQDYEKLSDDEKDRIVPPYRRLFIDQLSAAPSDDDTNYVALGQLLIEQYGRNFTPENVAALWVDRQSRNAYCTAERVAYLNFMKGYQPPESAVYKNPYREWIGAQIRGDYFGYVNPGDPETAADMAFRDACISHVKNGIYGEMFASAMIAAAAAEKDLKLILRHGLAQIPCTSRLHESIRRVISWYEEGASLEECRKRIHTEWNEYNVHDWCHTISNAMICAMALLWGEGDFEKTICCAVETGFDTDCNGATVGSVIGIRNGAKQIPDKWTKPLCGKLDTTVFGVGHLDIKEAAQKTLSHLPK